MLARPAFFFVRGHIAERAPDSRDPVKLGSQSRPGTDDASGFRATGFPFAHRQMNGGAERDRTVDLLTASQALSQLSYGPVSR